MRKSAESNHRRPYPAAMLPDRLRILYVDLQESPEYSLSQALENDSATKVKIESSGSLAGGLSRLREECYDAVVISLPRDECAACEQIEALRTAGCEEPVVVLGQLAEEDMVPLCLEVGVDAYLCWRSSSVRMFLWTLARAIERRSLLKDHERLLLAERSNAQRDLNEAELVLSQQRSLVAALETLSAPADDLPDSSGSRHGARISDDSGISCKELEELRGYYRELLKAFVVMGSGTMPEEIHRFALRLGELGHTGHFVMQLHVQTLEGILKGLGSRSSRHIIHRAEQLILELMLQLCEHYGRRARDFESQTTHFGLGTLAANPSRSLNGLPDSRAA